MSYKIYIDPGHGGSDPGAVGYVKEREVAVKVANFMNDYLVRNHDVITKVSNGTSSTHKRSAEANKWGADLFVSIHFNAGKGDGYEAWVYSSANKSLGQIFEKHVKATGQNSRGIKYSTQLNVLRLTNMKAILNEIAFVDNSGDIDDWDEDTELRVMGNALAEASVEYLGAGKGTGTTTSKPATTSKPVATKSNWISDLQAECNKQGFSKQTVDGDAGPKTLAGCPILRLGTKGNITKIMQKRLISLGYSCGSYGADGQFGAGTKSAVIKFQKAHRLYADGIIGQNTWRKLLGL